MHLYIFNYIYLYIVQLPLFPLDTRKIKAFKGILKMKAFCIIPHFQEIKTRKKHILKIVVKQYLHNF